MKKLTKLLSVFAVAGAMCAGTAALAGCGEEPHKHTPVEHEAKAATCTEAGYSQKYYTCDSTECADKYYSDEACTTALDIATITLAATGHTEVYTDKQNGTHGITCEHGDLTETTEAHVDANDDATCDKCSAKFFAAGKYYNEEYGFFTEIEIKANGKVVYNEQEYTLSAVSAENAATFTVGEGETAAEYTLTKTETGYKLALGEGTPKDYVKVPETYAEAVADFAGVYSVTGTYVYSDMGEYFKLLGVKVTADQETAESKILITAVKVDKEDGTNNEGSNYKQFTYYEDASSATVKYNQVKVGNVKLVATSANVATAKLTIGYGDESVELTKDAQAAAPVIPASMDLPDFTAYRSADETLTLYAMVDEAEEKIYKLNYSSVYLISGDATSGYVVQTMDANYSKVNYVVKINATDKTVDLFEVDGTTKVATLSLVEQTVPTLKLSTTTPVINNEPVVDMFNEGYALYKVESAGWYYFGSDLDLTIYTKVANHKVDVQEGTYNVYGGFASKGIELKAGTVIAIDSYKASAELVASVSPTNIDSTVIKTFEGFTAAQQGYYSYEYEAWGYPETVEFEVKEDKVNFKGSDLDVVAYDGVNYLIDCYGSSVKFSFNDQGNIAVEKDMSNDLTDYVALKGVKPGVGGGDVDEPALPKAVAGENTVTANPYTGGAELQLNKVGTWTVAYGEGVDYIYVEGNFVLDGGTITITDTAKTLEVYVKVLLGDTATFTLTLTEGSGEELGSGLKLGENTISEFNSDYLATVTFTATEAGDYTFDFAGVYGSSQSTTVANSPVAIGLDGTGTKTVTLTAGQEVTIVVEKSFDPTVILTIAKAGATDSGLKLGENTISEFNSDYLATVTFTATDAGDYTFDFAGVYGSSQSTTIDNSPVAIGLDGTGTKTLTLTAGQEVTIVVEKSFDPTVTLTITKA